MSLTSIMNIATSGLQTAQTQLRVVSDNVSNVNTPGYIRKIADQSAVVSNGAGGGVEIARVRLATDRFLQAATMNAGAEASRQGVRYELFDQIQSLFGDPSGDTSFFTQIDDLFATFAATAESPTSSPLRQDTIYRTQSLFDQAATISEQIQSVREEADGRLQSAVAQANDLLQQIEALNKSIASAVASGDDATGAQNAQANLVTQLSALMDVKVEGRSNGGVNVRTGTGMLLAGNGAATLSYTSAGAVDNETAFNEIWLTEPGGQKRPLLDSISSGQIKGLMELRDVEAPAAAERLGELMSKVADELNRAHNANSSVPAPNSLTGRNVGQTLTEALAGFGGIDANGNHTAAGEVVFAITNADGSIRRSVEVDFEGGGFRVNGLPATPAAPYTMGAFLTQVNAALGADGQVTFANGVMSVTATDPTTGVAIAQGTPPSDKGGRGFSHFFGLNDLVTTTKPTIYETGLTTTSLHGFTPGETMTFRFSAEAGAKLKDISVAVPGGAGTVGDLLAALNSPATGVGRYGSFSLDAKGALTFTPSGDPAPVMSVLDDRTTQVPSGVSVSELFGLGAGARASRADSFKVRSDIQNNPEALALAQLNLAAAAGTPALSAGDGRGALLLADAGTRSASFQSAGGAAGTMSTISRYASDFSGDLGTKAAAAKSRMESAGALLTEAAARQTSQEGVNLDEELVMMTTYQQAYNASARLVQAAKDMYDTLLGML